MWLCLVWDAALKEKRGLIITNPKKNTRVDGQRCSNEEATEIKLGLIILKEKWLKRKEKVQNKTCQLFSSLYKIIERRNNLFSISILDSWAVLITTRMSFPKVDITLYQKGLLQMVQEPPSLQVLKNSLNNHIRNYDFTDSSFEMSFRTISSDPGCSDAL